MKRRLSKSKRNVAARGRRRRKRLANTTAIIRDTWFKELCRDVPKPAPLWAEIMRKAGA